MLTNIIRDLQIKELEIKTLVQERDNFKSLLEEITLEFENHKLKSTERESNLETQLSKVKEDYKIYIESAYNHIEVIKGKLKSVNKRNIELLNENLELCIKLKKLEEKEQVAQTQTAKSIVEMDQQLINFVTMDPRLAQIESYDNGEEIELEQASSSPAISISHLFTRRTPPPRHSRNKRNSKRKSCSETYSWPSDNQNDGNREPREEMDGTDCPSGFKATSSDSHLEELIDHPGPEAPGVDVDDLHNETHLRVGGWFC